MQQENRFWAGLRKAYIRYDQMMEKQGFYVVMAVCIIVIAVSALYTFAFRESRGMRAELQASSTQAPLPVSMQSDQTLAQAQQSVQSQAEWTAVPTQEPTRFVQPVKGVTIRDYSISEPQLFEAAQYWRIHPGIDLACAYGTTISACASGEVSDVWQDQELGLCIRIVHSNGYETLYAGLSNASYVRAGDHVTQGQTIGHAGDGVLAEGDAEPHLHLEVRRNGSAVDPVKVFLGIER